MRLGGPARYVIEVESIQDVKAVFDFADGDQNCLGQNQPDQGQPSQTPTKRTLSDGQTTIETDKPVKVFPLGAGANSIGRDEGFDGILLLDRIKGIEVLDETEDGVLVRACGGEVWDDFVAFCADREYSGIEAMSGIPGLVGSAPVQNIGAYGQEISNVIDHVEAYDRKAKEMVILGKDEMQMGYRTTIFNTGAEKDRYFITAVTVELENREFLRPPFYASLQAYLSKKQGFPPQTDHSKLPEIEDRPYSPNEIREAVLAIRGDKLPDPAKIASAGSFFKNVYISEDEAEAARAKGLKVYDKPNGGHMINSGYLIQDCGLSGQLLHGMRVNKKAALVLINESAKNYQDLAAARAEIKKAVKDKFGYDLEQEPVEIA